jgi:intergrase/recombinase
MRPNVLKALSALAKYSGQYEDWKNLVKSYGLTWVGKNADEVFIDRMSNVKDPNEIWNWIHSVKEVRPDLEDLLDLMALTGLRFVEGVNCCNLIKKLSKENKLDTYYIEDRSALEHYRFKEIFIRNSKKAFVSFAPSELVASISKSKSYGNPDSIQKLLQREGLPARFGDIREAHGTYLTKYLKESEINFLHGRVTASIFMANYFNPSLIVDLKERTFLAIKEIKEKIK